MNKYVLKWLLLTAVAMVLLAGCGGSGDGTGSESESGSSENETIRIGYVSILSNAPAAIAKEQELMKEQGLEAEFYSFGNGPDLYKALSSGKLDVAYAGIPAAVNWVSRGAETKVIGKVSDGKFGVMVNPSAGINTTADFKGKKIGSLVQGSGADILLRGLVLPEAGLTEQDVTITQMQMPVMEQAIVKGSIDAAVVAEPFLTMAELRGASVIQEIPDPALVVLATTDILENAPETVEKFMAGHEAAISFVNEQTAEAAGTLAASFNVPAVTDAAGKEWSPEDVLTKALERHTFSSEITEDDKVFYQEVADMNYELGMIDEPLDVNTLFAEGWVQ